MSRKTSLSYEEILFYMNNDPRVFEEYVTKRRIAIRAFIKTTAGRFEINEPILDLGSGYRSNKLEICGDRDCKYITLDINPDYKPDIVADAQDLKKKLENNSIGTIVCTQLLEHVPYPQKVVDEAFRVLDSQGLLVISVPFNEPIHEKPYQQDYWRFTPRGLEVLLLDKFSILQLEMVGEKLDPKLVFCVAQKKGG